MFCSRKEIEKFIQNPEYTPTPVAESLCVECKSRPRAYKGFYLKVPGEVVQRFSKYCNTCLHKKHGNGKTNKYKKLNYKKLDYCEKCGYEALLPSQLDVHHIDGDHLNNEIDNLMTICANCHRALHSIYHYPAISKNIWPRIKNLNHTKEEIDSFVQWLSNKSRPWVYGLSLEEQDGYFLEDYEKWKLIYSI